MKKTLKSIISIMVTAALLMSAAACYTTAAAKNTFTLKVKSNFFPEKTVYYSDLDKLEDENGDVFITVEFKFCAKNKYLVNLDVDELTWDNKTLEYKESYNTIVNGKRQTYDFFDFLVKQNMGNGMVNTFGDSNKGRIVGNHTAVSPAAYAYEEGGSPVTMIRTRFKVLDQSASYTEVTCDIDTISLDDDDNPQPYSRYPVIVCCELDNSLTSLYTVDTQITPKGTELVPSIKKGDVNGDGEVNISDATDIQRYAAKLTVLSGSSLKAADVNGDGTVNINDSTVIQKYVAKIITKLG